MAKNPETFTKVPSILHLLCDGTYSLALSVPSSLHCRYLASYVNKELGTSKVDELLRKVRPMLPSFYPNYVQFYLAPT
eukprot:496409-Rhodomonas_salina.1